MASMCSPDDHLGGRSPLLANIALHMLDEAWAGGGQRLGELVKYADRLVVLCDTKERAEKARERVAAVLDGLGLRLHRRRPGSRTSHAAPTGSCFWGSSIRCASPGSSRFANKPIRNPVHH
jgi:hypothetical protein